MQAQTLRAERRGSTPTNMAARKKKREPGPAGQALAAAFAKHLKAWRLYKDLSQMDVAYRAGLVTETIRQYEAQRRSPRLEEIGEIAKALEMDPEVLIFRDAPDKEKKKDEPAEKG